MGKVSVLLFAAAAEAAGQCRLDVEIGAGIDAAKVLDLVVARCPGAGDILRQSALAVNERYATPATPVRSGDVVAIIPPVSGG